jgi:Transposase, Mutator family
VVGIFPNDAAVTRLATAVLIEAHDEWQIVDRRYLSEGSMALLDPISDDGGRPKEVRRATAELVASSSTVTEVHDEPSFPPLHGTRPLLPANGRTHAPAAGENRWRPLPCGSTPSSSNAAGPWASAQAPARIDKPQKSVGDRRCPVSHVPTMSHTDGRECLHAVW